MLIRKTIRVGLVVIVALAGSACATGSDVQVAWGPEAGPMCTVRVESAYDMPVEAAARVGVREISLGVVDPDGEREFGVPCAHRAVTVFRVLRSGDRDETRLGAHSRALHARRVTVVKLQPSATRLPTTPTG
jgi:hypothetical protein